MVRSSAPITGRVVKFGGQPVWAGEPRWPSDPYDDDQLMLFLCQIPLDERLYPGGGDTTVYLFVSVVSEPIPNEAVVAVIQSPRGTTVTHDGGATYHGDCVDTATGPSIHEFADDEPVPTEYEARLGPVEPENPVSSNNRAGNFFHHADDASWGYRFPPEIRALAGNKIGGQALRVLGLDVPPVELTSDEWLPLLQLAPLEGYADPTGQGECNFYPFHLNLYPSSILSSFISRDLTRFSCVLQVP